jgi:TM2 domain-containing membrane protein YozV
MSLCEATQQVWLHTSTNTVMSDSDTNPPTVPQPPSTGESAPQVSAPLPAAVPQISSSEIQSKKLAAGLLGILLGGLGIHKFYLGYQQEGVIMLLVTILVGGFGTIITCGLGASVLFVMPTIGLIEGIMYLTKSDQDFADTYITGRKTWF